MLAGILVDEAYLQSCQISIMDVFAKIFNGYKRLTNFAKKDSIIDVCQGAKRSSGCVT